MTEEAAKTISERFVADVAARISANQRVRRNLPEWGRINVERQLPYLVIYRRPHDRDDRGTDRLAVTAASYLTASPSRRTAGGVKALAIGVAGALADVFGAVLVVELWTAADAHGGDHADPAFRVTVPRKLAGCSYVEHLVGRLGRVRIMKQAASSAVDVGAPTAPPGYRPIFTPGEASRFGCHLIGVEMTPVHYGRAGEQLYPLVLRDLRRQLSRALGHAFYEFARTETPRRPRSYHDLGRRAMVKAVWEADRRLAEVGGEFDLLLSVTPANTEQAWHAFRRSRFDRSPTFRYRPLPVDPSTLKRRLHDIRLDAVEDPTVAHLFHEQRETLDRQLTLLADRERPAFLYDGLALFGGIDDGLAAAAMDILERVEPRRSANGGRVVDCHEFAAMARAELDHYRTVHPGLPTTVEVRSDISSLMVSRGNLFVGESVRIPKRRARALIQHEVGTHVVTHVNGSQQRLSLLASGLAGYEALQEGMGVFAEYLVGGLSPARLRLLAARVTAASTVVDGAAFIETFRELSGSHGLSKRSAFLVAMRVHRGGGFIKDSVYLRGLDAVLGYVRDGGDLSTILVGKVAVGHAGMIEELLRRRVVREPLLMPSYLEDEGAQRRLAAVRNGLTLEHITAELSTRKDRTT